MFSAALIGTTKYEEYLVVFITAQSLVGTARVVLIIRKLEYFARLAKNAYSVLFFGRGCFGDKNGHNGHFLHC